MKKFTKSCLLAVLTFLLSLFIGIGAITLTPASAADEKTEVSVTGIQKRDQHLLLFLSESDYTTGNDLVGTRKDGLNTLTNIKVYTDATNSVTLQVAHEAEGTTLENYFFLWGEANTITFAMGNAYDGKAIYAVEIPAGTEFPSQNGGAGFVTTADVTYYNSQYDNNQDSEFYVSWTTTAPVTPEPPVVEPEDKTEISVTGIQKRLNELLFFLSESDYTTGNDLVGTRKDGLNTLTNIKVYTDATNSVTLQAAHEAEGTTLENYFFLWGEANTITFAMGNAYNGKAIYAVEIPAGTEFPSQNGGAGFVTTTDVTYYNSNYGTDQLSEGSDWYVSWTTTAPVIPEPPVVEPDEKTDVTVSVTKMHDRDNRLFFFLSEHDYADVAINTPVDSKDEGLNTLDNILVYSTKSSYKTLRSIYESTTDKAKYFNLYGENGVIVYDVKTANNEYNGANLFAVKILAGCQFASATGEYNYVTETDVTWYNTAYGGATTDISHDSFSTTETSTTEFATSISAVQYRDNRLILKLTKSNYTDNGADVAPNSTLTADDINASTILDSVRIYTSETEYKTLSEVFAAGTHEAWYNLYGESPSVAFALGHEYTGDEIYAIEILSGAHIPSYYESETLIVNDGLYYKNNEYGTVKEALWFVDWTLQMPSETDTEIALTNQIHIRADVKDDGSYVTTKLYLFLSGVDYRDYAGGTQAVPPKGQTYADLTDFNTLDSILLWTSETEYLTLREVHFNSVDPDNRPATGEVYFNCFGEWNSLVFDISGYNGLSFVKITVLEGCEFPSARGLAGNINADKAYVNTETVNFIDWLPDETFSTNWRIANDNGATDVSSVAIDAANGIFSFGTTINDYPTETLNIDANHIEEALTNNYKKILIDGVTLEEICINGTNADGKSYFNYGANGIFAIELPGFDLSNVSKIIFMKGCQFPMYKNTPIGIENYGVMYYTLENSVMFVKNAQGEFEKADSITWTVQFGNVTTKEVADGAMLGTLPEATLAGHKFIGWYNGAARVTDKTVVTSALTLQAKFVKVHTVTYNVDGGSAVEGQTVEDGEKFTKPADPTKDGFVFKGWYNGDVEFDFNKVPTADVTLTAKWEAVEDDVSCFGGIGLSGLASVLLLPLTIKLFKRKDEEN